ncbi:hypothetical protein [Carnobacterium maltaromaticum]|uniref:hypothetical protein n=1 Tax=Carnobacterium maltaromaticum TaxID=2751 RepID=UPI0005548721|nr:hypothetical protein [Carnobacterium maltaromaticum]KRN62737.1 hypothetical protein IV70_GL003443 [Carnobacterium maltaromaticum DSM 20342]
MMKRKSEIEGLLTRLDKQNERSFNFFESKNIQVRNLKGSFAFREMMTGAIYSALQHYGNAVFIMWITGIYEVKSEVCSYEYVQEKIDSGKWELMVNLQTVTATDEFFRGEAKKLAKENMELRHKEGEK